jgi:glycerophosphoryl diester phosphodiesterase
MSFFEHLSGTGYVCAHRGARSIAPENTMLALEEARRCGSDLWEADVQFTADGELVIFHDDNLVRTTDVVDYDQLKDRNPWAVSDFTLSELQMLNLGEWFIQTDPYGTIAAGTVQESQFPTVRAQRISRLEDVLRYCRQHDFPFNLEIKDQHDRLNSKVVAAAVLERLKSTGMEELALVSSFNHDYLRQIKEINPAIDTAALVEVTHPNDMINYLKHLQVSAYHPDWHITDADLIRQLKDEGIRVNLWTVNDMDKAREFIADGATFICTDWPQVLVKERHSA